MNTLLKHIIPLIVALTVACSCSGSAAKAGTETGAEAAPTKMEAAAFSADSAMEYARRQVAFGPRTPGSAAHDACRDYLVAQLRAFGADTVMVQSGSAKAWDGKTLPISNIFAQYNREATARVILLAHYDTRPWADREPDEARRNTPIDGANDGASGVAVLLEIARQLQLKAPEIGVDILLTDVEDYGAPDWAQADNQEYTWCLGADHFAANMPYSTANLPRFGILLDMVGGRNARFHREYLSSRLAQSVTAKVWAVAKNLGLSSRFVEGEGNAITDDHLPLIRRGIPVCNIIENNAADTGTFPSTWHTLSDNIANLDPAAMADAGTVVLTIIYNEKP